MPRTEVVFYRDDDGSAEFAKCQVRISRLAECGHDLRRPEAEYLRDGV